MRLEETPLHTHFHTYVSTACITGETCLGMKLTKYCFSWKIFGAKVQSDQITESQNYRAAQAGRDLKRPSGPTFRGKGSLDNIIQHPVLPHLENFQQWQLYHIPEDVVLLNVYVP